jgi:hypothetical protein
MMLLRRQGLREEKRRLYEGANELTQRIDDMYKQFKTQRRRQEREETWEAIQSLKKQRQEVYGRLNYVKSDIQAINFALGSPGAPRF